MLLFRSRCRSPGGVASSAPRTAAAGGTRIGARELDRELMTACSRYAVRGALPSTDRVARRKGPRFWRASRGGLGAAAGSALVVGVSASATGALIGHAVRRAHLPTTDLVLAILKSAAEKRGRKMAGEFFKRRLRASCCSCCSSHRVAARRRASPRSALFARECGRALFGLARYALRCSRRGQL